MLSKNVYVKFYLINSQLLILRNISHVNTCFPSHPTPVMEIHGTADGTVPYNGYSSFLPVDTIVKHWVLFNNCSQTPTITSVPNINILDGCTAEHYVYQNGNNGSTVELYKIIGGGHSWPGAPININVTNMDFSASTEIWRFFSEFKLNELTNINSYNNEQLIQIYPNPSHNKFILNFPDYSKKKITVCNAIGQFVNSFECLDKKTELNLENSGLYFITILQDNNVITKKVVKL